MFGWWLRPVLSRLLGPVINRFSHSGRTWMPSPSRHRPLEDERKNYFGDRFEIQSKDNIVRKDDGILKARIEAAENLYKIHNQARSQISEVIMERKMDRDRVTSELKYQAYPRWRSYRNTIEWNNKEIKRLQCALYDLDGPKPVTPLHYRLKHCCNTRAKERQLVREIKEAEADAAVKATVTSPLSSKEDIEDRIKSIAINRDGLKKNGWGARSKVEHLQRELEAIENDIRRLQTQLAAANQKKNHANRDIFELKRQRDP